MNMWTSFPHLWATGFLKTSPEYSCHFTVYRQVYQVVKLTAESHSLKLTIRKRSVLMHKPAVARERVVNTSPLQLKRPLKLATRLHTPRLVKCALNRLLYLVQYT